MHFDIFDVKIICEIVRRCNIKSRYTAPCENKSKPTKQGHMRLYDIVFCLKIF